jgi:hypothetical protein
LFSAEYQAMRPFLYDFPVRSLACFLIGIGGCLAGAAAHAQPVTVRSCLEGWKLPALQLPYFPRYWPSSCQRSDPPKGSAPRYFSGSTRAVKLVLAADFKPMDAALGKPVDRKSALRSTSAHFDAWLTANGFQRTDSSDAAATYEAPGAGGTVRLSLAWPSPDALVIEVAQLPGVVAGVVLPRPDPKFRFYNVTHAGLFKLPGMEVVTETVSYGDQEPIEVTNPVVRAKLCCREHKQLFLPEKRILYRLPKDVNPTEADLAMREALKEAGWSVQPRVSGTGTEASFAASDRKVDLKVRFFRGDGYEAAQATVRDRVAQQAQVPVQASLEALGHFTFAPAYDAGGAREEETAMQVAAASDYFQEKRSRIHPTVTYEVEVAPVAADTASSERAKTMAAKVKDDLTGRGWDAARLVIPKYPGTPGPEATAIAAGVRLTFYECRTRTTDRPGGAVVMCECSREHGERNMRPGACS